jgi:4'-phosphopantetheinyl transferase
VSTQDPILHPVILAVPPDTRRLSGREKSLALRRQANAALVRSASLGGLSLGALHKGSRGQPLPSNGVYWSLSHTTDFVAAVAAPHRIGIDIERIAAFTAAVQDRVAGIREWELAPAVDETLFCRYWTAKEAVLKAVGVGLSGLSRCTVTGITDESLLLSYGPETWTVSHCVRAAGHLAAITVAAGRAEWHFLAAEPV